MEGPLVLRILVAFFILELVRVNVLLTPALLVCEMLDAPLVPVNNLMPLKHLDLALQPVAVLSHDSELDVFQFDVILRLA